MGTAVEVFNGVKGTVPRVWRVDMALGSDISWVRVEGKCFSETLTVDG